MFTGIIEAAGAVKRLEPMGGDLRFVIDSGSLDMSDVQVGDSIAVNGVCLYKTVIINNNFELYQKNAENKGAILVGS